MPLLPPNSVDPGRPSPARTFVVAGPARPPAPNLVYPAVDARTYGFYTGVHRLCTAGEQVGRRVWRARHRSASLQVGSRIERHNGRYGGRMTDGVGPHVV